MIDTKVFEDAIKQKTTFEFCKNYVMTGIVGATAAFEDFITEMELDESLTEEILQTAGELFIKALDAVKDEVYNE